MQTLELTWQGIPVTVTHKPQWLKGPYDHLELRAADPLPVTETGYRSHFIHPEELALFDSVETFVTEWLDEYAKQKKWLDYRETSRQGELF